MSTVLRTIRRRALTPDVAETSLQKRGFHRKGPAAQELLESIGKSFLTGYGYVMEARTATEATGRLEMLPAPFRGFAYEGAGMGATVLDGLPFGGRGHVAELLTGAGDQHKYMIYVGVGWAMARLPRFRWPHAGAFDPLLHALVLDGYGFHQAYFHTQSYVHRQHRDIDFGWPATATDSLVDRAIDQGIGRAMWFVGGTDVDRVADMIDGFPAARRGDLYAGTGLAATYAGGVQIGELELLRERAGIHRPQLATSSAFAAEARVRADLVTPHTALATEVLCGTTPQLAARITRNARPVHPVGDGLTAYESWRLDVAGQLESLGGVPA